VGEGRGNYYGDQGGNVGRDVGINSIKTNLPPFKGECNPDAYLEWESLCERIFQVNDLTEVNKSFFAIAQFKGFAITWWEYMKRLILVLQDGHPPPWTGLKALMRVKYVPERYRQELLAKLYNLRQGSKSVAAYYDEFQNLILKLEYTENEEHVVIRFKVGLNKEISSKMTIHKFASLNDIFEAANEVERELKEEKVPKYKGISSSNSWSKNKEGVQTYLGWNKNKDFKKPYEKKPFEGNTPKYPPREGGNNDPNKFPKGIQCHKCRGCGHTMCE